MSSAEVWALQDKDWEEVGGSIPGVSWEREREKPCEVGEHLGLGQMWAVSVGVCGGAGREGSRGWVRSWAGGVQTVSVCWSESLQNGGPREWEGGLSTAGGQEVVMLLSL